MFDFGQSYSKRQSLVCMTLRRYKKHIEVAGVAPILPIAIIFLQESGRFKVFQSALNCADG